MAILTAAAPAWPVRTAQRINPDVLYYVPTWDPVVALTIDDGPSPDNAKILEVLGEYEAHATFFVIGENVNRDPEAARTIVEQGHEIAHHMMTDEPSIALPDTLFDQQFETMDRMLAELGGSHLFRPGSGWYDRDMIERVGRRGYRLTLGSVYPLDAQIGWSAFSAWFITNVIQPGSIIVLHEGGARGERTIRTLRTILPELKRRGYTVVTVTELLGHAPQPEGGHALMPRRHVPHPDDHAGG